MSEEISWFELSIHSLTAIVGLAAAGFLIYAYRRFGPGQMADFIRFTTLGITVLSLIHVFDDAEIFLPFLEEFGFYVEHAVSLIGFALAGFGAWELFKLSKKVGIVQ